MAAQIFPFGTALTVVWHLTKPDGTPFSLNGYSYHAYYKTGNKEIEANSSHLTASGNTLSIVIPAAEPVAPGEYAMRLVLRQNGNLFCTLNYNAAFVLSRQLAVDPAMQNQEQAGSVVHLYTVAEFYLLAPVVPVVGEDGFWWVNGARIVTPDGENVPADHSVRYDSTTKYLIIDEGRVDASGQSIQQTITDVADALEDWGSRYAEAEGSEDESEAGDGSRWGAFKAADASRQEYETSRQQAEGQGDYSSDPNSRRVKEADRQTAETARQKAEGQLGSGDADYANSRIKKELDRQKAEGQLGSGDADYADSRIKKEIDRQTAEGTPDDDPDDPTVLTRWAQYKRAVAATEAANTATDRANTAAAAAEHQVDVKRGYGIQSVTQPVVATTNGGVNSIRVTTEDGKTFDFYVRNGKSSAGFFATASALSTEISSPNVGDYAFVSKAGDGTWPAYVYVCATAGTWTATENEFTPDDPTDVLDVLNSTSTTASLSANQGRELDGKIRQLGQYIENPEWVRVVTDSENKILYGVKTDGKFYFGDDCPPQVVEYVTAQLEELEGDFTTLLNAKVDKVTGKSLIDSEFADAQSVIENPEWDEVVTDKDGRILEGWKKGVKFIANFNNNDEIKKIWERIEERFPDYLFIKKQEDTKVESRLIPYSRGTSTPAIDYAPGYERLVIGFMTDNHIDLGDPQASYQNVVDSIDFFNKVNLPISAILEGGDVITQYSADKAVYMGYLKSFFDITWDTKTPFLFTKGNHDVNAINVTPSSVLDDDDWGHVWFNRAEEEYGIVRKTKSNGKKSGYYYYDIPSYKVRIISLDCYDLDFSEIDAGGNVLYTPGSASYMANEQMNWLASTALNFDNKSDKGWGVLIFLHFSGNPADEYGTTIEPRFRSIYGAFNRMLVAFSNKTTYSEEYTFADNAFYDLSISADWSRYAELESAPYLIGVLSGHRHWDYNYNWNGVQNIFTANQFCGENYSDNRVKRVAGTQTQNLFDVFLIDIPKRKIRAIRYGAGLNCYGVGGDRWIPDGLGF